MAMHGGYRRSYATGEMTAYATLLRDALTT
jgi:hypothetical protein